MARILLDLQLYVSAAARVTSGFEEAFDRAVRLALIFGSRGVAPRLCGDMIATW